MTHMNKLYALPLQFIVTIASMTVSDYMVANHSYEAVVICAIIFCIINIAIYNILKNCNMAVTALNVFLILFYGAAFYMLHTTDGINYIIAIGFIYFIKGSVIVFTILNCAAKFLEKLNHYR